MIHHFTYHFSIFSSFRGPGTLFSECACILIHVHNLLNPLCWSFSTPPPHDCLISLNIPSKFLSDLLLFLTSTIALGSYSICLSNCLLLIAIVFDNALRYGIFLGSFKSISPLYSSKVACLLS